MCTKSTFWHFQSGESSLKTSVLKLDTTASVCAPGSVLNNVSQDSNYTQVFVLTCGQTLNISYRHTFRKATSFLSRLLSLRRRCADLTSYDITVSREQTGCACSRDIWVSYCDWNAQSKTKSMQM